MNLENDDFLSAFLDGELDAGPQSRVESALAADPRLSDRLRELATVRDLVAGLSRPVAPLDSSEAILDRIRRGNVFSLRNWSTAVSTGRFARVATLTAAAAVLLACTLLGINRLDRGKISRTAVVSRVDSAARSPVTPIPVAESPALASHSDAVEKNIDEPPLELLPKTPGKTSFGGNGDVAKVRELFEDSRLDRVLVVTDVIGGSAEKQVGELLKTTARSPSRSAFHRIVVTPDQGIMIDPDRPGRAVAFAVMMNEVELGEFQQKLNLAFPGAVEAAPPRDDLLTKLAAVGDITLIKGTSVAELKPPRTLSEEESIIASKGKLKAQEQTLVKEHRPDRIDTDPFLNQGHRLPGPDSSLVVVPRETSTPEQLRSGPHPSVRTDLEEPERKAIQRPITDPKRTESASVRPGESLIVVWVVESQGPK